MRLVPSLTEKAMSALPSLGVAARLTAVVSNGNPPGTVDSRPTRTNPGASV
jgi:hypothetical protein